MSQNAKPERPSSGKPVDAVPEETENASETPMIAVWLTLGVILFAGIYGLYLGIQARSNAASEPKKDSLLLRFTPESTQAPLRRLT